MKNQILENYSSTATTYTRLALRLANDLVKSDIGSSILIMAADYDRVAVETTSELAWQLADDQGYRVLLVDGSFNRLGLTKGLGGEQERGIRDLLATKNLSEDDVLATIRTTAHSEIGFIPVGSLNGPGLSPARADTLRQFLSITSQMADFVLIQGAVVDTASLSLAFGANVDAVLLVTLDGEIPVKKLESAQQVLSECGADKIGIVIGTSRSSPQ
ncbi:MAG: Mrp family chromosome partitioning ATPase, partial [Porticoccaceae bacterium]